MGILADVASSSFADATPLHTLEPDVRRRIEEGELLVITKTKAYSTVHRRARMDYVGVRIVSPEGQVVGEARLIGLFTSKAYMEPAAKTPLLHHKLEQIIAAEDLIPGSHDYKEVVELFESFPRDELFQASTEELRGLVVGLLQLEKHGGHPRAGAQGPVSAGRCRSSWRCPGRSSAPRSASGCRRCSASASAARRSTTTCRWARRSRRDLLHRARRAGRADPRDPVRGAGGRGRAAGAHVGRRPPRRPHRAPRAGTRARCWQRSTARGSPTTTRRPRPTGPRWRWTSSAWSSSRATPTAS